MTIFRGGFICLIIVLLTGCSEKPKEPPQAINPHDHVWSAQTRALEKARAVEQQVLDAAAVRDREVDKQTQ